MTKYKSGVGNAHPQFFIINFSLFIKINELILQNIVLTVCLFNITEDFELHERRDNL